MHDLIAPFYDTVAGALASHLYETGQFFDAPAVYLARNPIDIVRGRYDATGSRYTYTHERVTVESFADAHEPIQPLGLRSNERATILNCKIRPVIIISALAHPWRDGSRRSDDCFLVAPVYSFAEAEGKVAYSPEFIKRIQAYAYNTFFYLPANRVPFLQEGFVRFDRIQAVRRDLLRNRPLRLSADALACFQAWLTYYVAPEMTDGTCVMVGTTTCALGMGRLVLDYRREAMKALGLT